MNFFEADQVRATVAGVWLTRHDDLPPATGVSTDTRTLRPGEVFVAIRGERTDGHRHLGDAARAGARMAVVEGAAADEACGLPLVRVADTRAALLRLGAVYRQTLHTTRVVGVAGSNGKTTTVRLIHAVLSSSLRGVCPPKSYNNDIGVPLTILSARRSDRFLICEIGTNAPGEVAPLARAVQPDLAILTSIGREHLEGLGSLRGVAQEEAALLAEVRPGGLAVIPADATALRDFIPPGLKTLTFGFAPDAGLRVSGVETGPEGTRFILNRREEWRVPLPGAHNALNAAAAIAAGRFFGLDPGTIAAALASASGAEMRMQRIRVGGIDVYNDAYNANPDSMLAGIATLAALGRAEPARRRVAVLGDMLELGDAGPDLHREIADAILSHAAADTVVAIGPLMEHLAARLRREWPDSRIAWLSDLDGPRLAEAAALLRPGDIALLKGSRRMALERLVKHLLTAEDHSCRVTTPAHAPKAPAA